MLGYVWIEIQEVLRCVESRYCSKKRAASCRPSCALQRQFIFQLRASQDVTDGCRPLLPAFLSNKTLFNPNGSTPIGHRQPGQCLPTGPVRSGRPTDPTRGPPQPSRCAQTNTIPNISTGRPPSRSLPKPELGLPDHTHRDPVQHMPAWPLGLDLPRPTSPRALRI